MINGDKFKKEGHHKETTRPYLTVKDKKQAICLLQQFFSPNAQSLLDFPRVSSWLKFKYFQNAKRSMTEISQNKDFLKQSIV